MCQPRRRVTSTAWCSGVGLPTLTQRERISCAAIIVPKHAQRNQLAGSSPPSLIERELAGLPTGLAARNKEIPSRRYHFVISAIILSSLESRSFSSVLLPT